MKISASIYSDKSRSLEEVILDLVDHQVELLHVDCNDDLTVFEDIKEIRSLCDLPIDLHIITSQPEKFYGLLRTCPVEYVTFQFENLESPLEIPSDISGKKGLAVITPTPISVFEEYSHFDFILIMATIPGQSGGKFDTINFQKVRDFRKAYPKKQVHVDGGVNGEVSFILRNMGVSSSVSGSYLFNGPSVGHALMNLTKREVKSAFKVEDFMISISETPYVFLNEITLEKVLLAIEKGAAGFCLVVDETFNFVGIISNADVRKGMIRHLDDLNAIDVHLLINKKPVCIQGDDTVMTMLELIKSCSFPIMYLPVLKNNQKAIGIVTFVNLIKGEL
jgi:ribulose-phosphate 3-epimerase